jgi:hypothetical protein
MGQNYWLVKNRWVQLTCIIIFSFQRTVECVLCRRYLMLIIEWVLCRRYLRLIIECVLCWRYSRLIIECVLCRRYLRLIIEWVLCRRYSRLIIEWVLCRRYLRLIIEWVLRYYIEISFIEPIRTIKVVVSMISFEDNYVSKSFYDRLL